MGISASSLLDQSKSDYIKGQAEAELKEFSPYYRKQYSVTHFHQVEDDLEQHKETITQLLKQRDTPEEGEVLYEDAVLHFDETRKWRERYVVVRANYCLECHDSLESYMKGVSARHKLLPTGGAVLTREECYMSMVDKCFPDNTSNVKEDFAPPLAGMPGQFPVYLRLPYRRDYYFCFRQEAKQADFLSILSDCIRHQNQDFLKRKTCEVQAFLKAIQLYRQEKGKYEAWDMLIGSDVRVMANLIMEQLLPTLEKDMLPRLKAKKTEKKRVWFATVEAAYILVQEHLLDGLSALKKECGIAARQQEVLIHSDMDQIVSARTLVENKLRASVSEPAEKFCLESVQPYLASALEELMEPISSGFQEGRQLSDSMMERICQDFQVGGITEGLNQALAKMARPNLLSCYQKIGSLEEKLPHLHQRFGFSNVGSLIHSAQIDLQQLIQNAAFTFQQLLHKAIQDNPEIAGSAMEKARHRVLKQYDYDSSSVRKRIFQEALVAVTLPHIKKNLAPIVKPDLQGLEQLIYADHANLVHVENVYEGILLQTLDKEVTKVVKEAASLKKHNLFTDSRDLLSQSSRSSLSSPTPSSPGSPASLLASHMRPAAEPERATVPSSPCMDNSLASDPLQEKEDVALPVTAKADAGIDAEDVVVTPAENEERKAQVVDVVPVADTPVAPEDAAALQTAATADADPAAEAEEAGAAAEAVNERREVLVEEEKIETSAEALTQSRDAPVEKALQGTPTPAGGAGETHDQEECIMPPPLEFANDQTPVCHLAEGVAALTVIHTEEEDSECSPPEVELEAPSCGEGSALAAGECSPALDAEEAELVAGSESSSLNVYAGSDCAASDLESMESGEKASSTSDPMEEEGDVTEWTASSSDPSADTLETPPVTRDGPSTLTGAYCGDATSREDAATEACKSPETATSEAPAEVPPPPGPDAPATDCIREIRDLVVEVIEVEELVQHYPSDIPADQ